MSDVLKEQVAKAVQESILDSGKFQAVIAIDIDYQVVSARETLLRVKTEPNGPRRDFLVKVTEMQ